MVQTKRQEGSTIPTKGGVALVSGVAKRSSKKKKSGRSRSVSIKSQVVKRKAVRVSKVSVWCLIVNQEYRRRRNVPKKVHVFYQFFVFTARLHGDDGKFPITFYLKILHK